MTVAALRVNSVQSLKRRLKGWNAERKADVLPVALSAFQPFSPLPQPAFPTSGAKLTVAVLCGLALAGAVAAFGQDAPARLTLHDALTRALGVNEQVERSREEIGAAEANQKYIFSQVLPRLNLNGATTKNSQEVSFGSGNDARTVLPGTDWNYRFVLSQPIYAGNRDRQAYEHTQAEGGSPPEARAFGR